MKLWCGENREGGLYALHNSVCVLTRLLGSEIMLLPARPGLAIPGVQSWGDSVRGCSFACSDQR